MNVEVRETSIANLVIIEVDLQKTIEIDVLPSSLMDSNVNLN
jgi:hypothetical protein